MNNEPVAWINKFGDEGWLNWDKASNADSSMPLYTHPAKTLTDEEIISSAEEAGFNWSEDKGIFVRHSNGSWIGLDSKMVDFARAILKRASEK